MTHQAGLVPIQTSQSFTAHFIQQLLSASYFFQFTDRERERKLWISSKHINLSHAYAMAWHMFWHQPKKKKALPSTVSKPHWHNKEHSGRPQETAMRWERIESEANRKIKVQRYFISADLIATGENEGSRRDQHQFNVIPPETFLLLIFIMSLHFIIALVQFILFLQAYFFCHLLDFYWKHHHHLFL